MRKTSLLLFFAVALGRNATADILAQWNFNSVPPDTATTTGSMVPSAGAGTISVIGGATQTYSSAAFTSGTSGESTDPATSDDTAYHTLTYPAPGTGNKTRGIQVSVSTVGYESISITWDQRQSPTASKYFRFQYSLDGVNFVDGQVLSIATADTWVNGRTVSLNSILGANENPNFAFRLVTEFEDSATGSGTAGFVGTSSGYSANGTVRFDMLTVSGTVSDPNAFPTISSIPNQTIRVDTPTDLLPFQVGDAETPAEQLIVNGTSSNQDVVPDVGILIEGTGSNRTVTVQGNFDATGTTTITLQVTDGGGKVNSTSFVLTILPANTPPTLSSITNLHTIKNTPFASVAITISDAEQSSDSLAIFATSSDQAVIPEIDITTTGGGDNRMLVITPAPDAVGSSVITLTVTDVHGLTASRTFNAMVVPTSKIVLSEFFNYPDGPLVPNSGRLWTTRAGTANEIDILSGSVMVTATEGEDVIARLIGGPYQTSGSTVLYASFDLTCSIEPRNQPQGNPDIFAHFSGTVAGDLRGRVLITTNNMAPGLFRLGVANGGVVSSLANVTNYPTDLSVGTTYQVVVAYDVAAGSSRLWVNPASGGGPVTAIDMPGPVAINSFGLRQSGGIGDMRIDNLLVGMSFESVTPHLARVRIRRNGDVIEVYWPSSGQWEGYVLESTPSLANSDWRQVQEAATTVGEWDIVTITEPTGERYFRLMKP